jgi:hypothetical protein
MINGTIRIQNLSNVEPSTEAYNDPRGTRIELAGDIARAKPEKTGAAATNRCNPSVF